MTGRSSPLDPVMLPDDPDLDVDQTPEGAPRPVHLRPAFLLLVFAGGTLGTAARAALGLWLPVLHGIPLATLICDISGAFLLGMLLEALARRGPDEGRRRSLRLLLGTGFLGGFTTYSAFSGDTASLIGASSAAAGISYALVTVTIGAAATWSGIALAALAGRRRNGDLA